MLERQQRIPRSLILNRPDEIPITRGYKGLILGSGWDQQTESFGSEWNPRRAIFAGPLLVAFTLGASGLRQGPHLGESLKKTFVGAAPAVGVAITLSAVCSAGPTQAVDASWESAYGPRCRDFGESAPGHATVRSVDHPTFAGVLREGKPSRHILASGTAPKH